MREQMEQHSYLATHLVLDDSAGVANTQDPLENVSPRWPLELDVQVVDFVSGYTVCGVLETFTPGEVAILLNEHVSEQRSVTVEMNPFVFDGHTLYCQPRKDKFEVHISIDDVEHSGLRRSPRFPVKLPAQLLLPHAEPVTITIVDISSDGLGIELPVPVETGQPIAVTNGSVFIFAIVRHCRQLSEGIFRAGAEMHHLFQGPAEPPKDRPRSNILQRVLGKRLGKQLSLPSNPGLTPRPV
jgi:hypothetical protein